MSNTQHKLDKARPPRVHITYDVEYGDATVSKELPLVIGVIGEFTESTDNFKERDFLKIDKDNFGSIMGAMAPKSEFLVDNILSEEPGTSLPITLEFNTMEDFSPDSIASQIEPLRKLLELREQLCELRNRAASNEKLKDKLSELLLLQQDKTLRLE